LRTMASSLSGQKRSQPEVEAEVDPNPNPNPLTTSTAGLADLARKKVSPKSPVGDLAKR
jgi:hypothetical protein